MIASKTLRMAAVICLMAAGSAWADEITDLRRQMVEMQAKLIKLEQAQTTQEQKIAAIKPGEFTIPETLKWVEKIKFYGDFRYRYENVSSETNGSGVDGVNRNRIRVRLGMTAKVNDEVNFDMRLATGKFDSSSGTGQGDPVSTNQNLGDSWDYKGIWLDRAYITWKPAAVDGLSVLAGKFGVPFMQVGKNQLLWDSDLNMEGIAAQYNRKLSDSTSMFANAGGFYVRMDKINNIDDAGSISMFGAQGGLTHKLDETNTLTGGLGYYTYGNIKGKSTLVKANNAKGNTTSGGNYVYGYDIIEAFGEYGTKIGNLPVGIYGNYAMNNASGVKEDTGWLIGASFNKCKDPGSWELSYDYRDLEKDAVVGVFSDSDFIGGGTNGKGHRFGLAYQLARNTQAGIAYFLDKKANSAGKIDDSYDRLQVDVMVKF